MDGVVIMRKKVVLGLFLLGWLLSACLVQFAEGFGCISVDWSILSPLQKSLYPLLGDTADLSLKPFLEGRHHC